MGKYFLDTEFIESGPNKPIQLISIGMVAEDGREFYAISNEFNPEDANPWVQEHVLPHLLINSSSTPAPNPHSLQRVGELIREFIGDDQPEFWGYYSDYDWVVFCQIFGAMIDLPEGWPMYCRDLKQWADDTGVTPAELPIQFLPEHHALADARWNRLVWQFLHSMNLTLETPR